MVGLCVGPSEGMELGLAVGGSKEGRDDGIVVGSLNGALVGLYERNNVGMNDGSQVVAVENIGLSEGLFWLEGRVD